jgi:hypothetical protein
VDLGISPGGLLVDSGERARFYRWTSVAVGTRRLTCTDVDSPRHRRFPIDLRQRDRLLAFLGSPRSVAAAR